MQRATTKSSGCIASSGRAAWSQARMRSGIRRAAGGERARDPAATARGRPGVQRLWVCRLRLGASRGARQRPSTCLRSQFCWAPPGQRYGDARRHLLAAFHGCIPVLTVPHGHHTFEEALPWRQMALVVPPERLASLPSILRDVTPADARRMRDELRRQRQRLWYASIYGECERGAAPARRRPKTRCRRACSRTATTPSPR